MEDRESSRITVDETTMTIQDLVVSGSPHEVGRSALQEGRDVEGVVRRMLDLGAAILLHGANRATVDTVTAEVDRLVELVAQVAAERLPEVLEAHSERLQTLFASHFDPGRSDSVQKQMTEGFRASLERARKDLVAVLLEDAGPFAILKAELGGKLTLLDSRQEQLVRQVSSLSERLSAVRALEDERERGTAKGAVFETQVAGAVDRALASFKDTVIPVGSELGLERNKAGDLVVHINPDDTNGYEHRFVVEAKCRKLSITAALRELDAAMDNREAQAGVLVFSRPGEAPLNGQMLRAFSGNRLLVVLDRDDPDPLPLEVACHLARTLALSSMDDQRGQLDSVRIGEEVRRLVELIDEARMIARATNAARRSLDQIDAAHDKLRAEALLALSAISDELRAQSSNAP